MIHSLKRTISISSLPTAVLYRNVLLSTGTRRLKGTAFSKSSTLEYSMQITVMRTNEKTLNILGLLVESIDRVGLYLCHISA